MYNSSLFQMNFKARSTFADENWQKSISKRVEAEQEKLAHKEQRINELNARKKQLLKENQELTQHLGQLKDKIKQQKQYDNPMVKQLREHFKALKEEIKSMALDIDEGDDVDIDNMTYQELLELGEQIGKVSKGLSKAKFQALQKFEYENDFCFQEGCTICCDQFTTGHECVRLECKHFFHLDCLKGWVQVEKICPNCKTEI